jgi:menaquinone-9 beta-reductase
MIPWRVDVVVIGGGPAGSVAALYAAKTGLSVCLIEKLPFPRETLCGEFLSHEVTDVLFELGLAKEFLSHSPARINHVTLCPDNGSRVSVPLQFPAYGMRRSTFDKLLLDAAAEAGVHVLQPAEAESVYRLNSGFEVTCKMDGDDQAILARWVVGAYGKASPLDKTLQRPFVGMRTRSNGIKAHVPTELLTEMRPDEILLCTGPNMYCGVNPVDGGMATVCLLEQRTENAPPLRARMRELGALNPMFGKIVRRGALSEVERAPVLGTGNLFYGERGLVEQGVFMVGDAARVIAPLSGDGIGMAMQGGRLLGRLFVEETHSPRGSYVMERNYKREWGKLFSTRVRTAMLLHRMLLSTRMRLAGTSLAASAPFLMNAAVKFTRGGRVMSN